MPIQLLQPPKRKRGSRYDYSADDVQAAYEAFADQSVEMPGDGPFESESRARSAANRLCDQLDETYGVRPGTKAWEAEDGWWFTLRAEPRTSRGKGGGKKQ